MPRGDNIHTLVRALNKGEKEQFLDYAARRRNQKGQMYLQLFRLLEQQNEYDEANICKKLKRTPTQLKKLRNYLKEAIFQSLHLHNRTPGAGYHMAVARILIQKGQYNQAKTLLKQGKALAEKGERFNEILEIIQLEKELIGIDDFEKVLILDDQENQVLHYIAYLSQLILARKKAQRIVKNQQYPFPQKKALLNQVISSLSANVPDCENLPKKLEYEVLKLKRIERRVHDDPINLTKLIEQIFLLVSSNKHLFSEEDIVQEYRAIITIYRLYGEYNKAEYFCLKFSSFQPETSRGKALKFIRYHSLQLIWAIETGSLEVGNKIVESFEENFEEYSSQIDSKSLLIVYYYLACYYQICSNFQKASFWLREILKATKAEQDIQVIRYSKLKLLFIYFDSGNFEMLDIYVEKAKRGIKSFSEIGLVGRTLISFFSDLLNNPKDAHKDIFKDYFLKITTMTKSKEHAKHFRYLEVKNWMSAYLSETSYPSEIKSSFEKKSAPQNLRNA